MILPQKINITSKIRRTIPSSNTSLFNSVRKINSEEHDNEPHKVEEI
jgi:hypothetical protein